MPGASKTVLLILFLTGFLWASAQSLGGHPIKDHLVSAVHPNSCNHNFVTGPPDDSTWVNFSTNQVISGSFSTAHGNAPGDDLLLETSFHPDNYSVRLLLSTNVYSAAHQVNEQDWTHSGFVNWKYLLTGCANGVQMDDRYVLPLDFVGDFNLSPNDQVIGLEITMLQTPGLPDFAGAFIIEDTCALPDLGNDTTLCVGQSLTLDATTFNATYLWQDLTTSNTYTVSQPGTYWVEVTDQCGTRSDSIQVSYHPVLNPPNLGGDTSLCPGESLLLDASTHGARYLWQDNSTDSIFRLTQPGTYWVQISDTCSQYVDSIKVNYITPVPPPELGPDTSLCSGTSLLLDVSTPGTSYLWQDSSTSSNLLADKAGTYWVQVTDSCGIQSDTIRITEIGLPTMHLGSDTSLCQGQSLKLAASVPNGTYRWQDGSSSGGFTVTQAGLYWVEVSSKCGTVSDSIRIAYLGEAPKPQLGQDTSLCEGEVLLLDSRITGANYLWSDNSSEASLVVHQAGLYWLLLSTACGTRGDSIRVNYSNCECEIFFPNSFTPNEDGLNDHFAPKSACHFSQYNFSIFSRWGQVLFSTHDPEHGWDGKLNARNVPVGSYVFQLKYRIGVSDEIVEYGILNLLR